MAEGENLHQVSDSQTFIFFPSDTDVTFVF